MQFGISAPIEKLKSVEGSFNNKISCCDASLDLTVDLLWLCNDGS